MNPEASLSFQNLTHLQHLSKGQQKDARSHYVIGSPTARC
jgi:hypothetical protein